MIRTKLIVIAEDEGVGSVWIGLDGTIGQLILMDTRVSLNEAESIRDELDRIIGLMRTGRPPIS